MHKEDDIGFLGFYNCGCGGDPVLKVWISKEDPSEAYLSFLDGAKSGKTNWSYRLSYIWRLLTTGTPYSDYFILEAKDVPDLIELLGNVKEVKP